MLSVAAQLDHADELLLRTGGAVVRSVILVDPIDLDAVGVLEVTLVYPRGHRLDVSLTVDVTPGYPEWVAYSFQLTGSNGRCIFRYDNAPHHRALATFPHHKHIGPDEAPLAHHLPTLHEIVDEVIDITAVAPSTS
jgi:hypothetical protein